MSYPKYPNKAFADEYSQFERRQPCNGQTTDPMLNRLTRERHWPRGCDMVSSSERDSGSLSLQEKGIEGLDLLSIPLPMTKMSDDPIKAFLDPKVLDEISERFGLNRD